MSGRDTTTPATDRLDPEVRAVLGKLEGVRPRAELIETLSRDLGLEDRELATLVGVGTETIGQWDEKHNSPAAERLDDLADIAALLIRRAGLRPRSVAPWLRSRNPSLAWARPLDALRQQGYLPVLDAADTASRAASRSQETRQRDADS